MKFVQVLHTEIVETYLIPLTEIKCVTKFEI